MTENEDQIVKVVELPAPVARVWQALTKHEEFGAWFGVDLDQPFAVGGASTGHMTHPDYDHLPWLAHVDRMDQEQVFSFTWNDVDEASQLPADEQPTLHVVFELEAMAGGTRLTITESGFSAIAAPRRFEVLRSNREGWNIQAENLANYLKD